MKSLNLFMVLLGCKPQGRNTEQHDVFFTIAANIKEIVSDIFEFWPAANHKIHMDAWRKVTQVGAYDISIEKKGPEVENPTKAKLFFINLGGYKQGEFEEYHYKMVIASANKEQAIREACKTTFYKHTGFNGATAHVDDNYGIYVDDIYEIMDILPRNIKDQYKVVLTPCAEIRTDSIQLGYMKLDKL